MNLFLVNGPLTAMTLFGLPDSRFDVSEINPVPNMMEFELEK